MNVLTVDGGSSSLKVALYEMPAERCMLEENVPISAQAAELRGFIDNGVAKNGAIGAVGHRLVFGGTDYVEPQLVTPAVLDALEALVPFDPLHLRAELDAVRLVQRVLPGVPNVVCFDTAFHARMPEIAKRYPLGDAFDGVARFGYHGISLEYIVSVIGSSGRTIVAHLGSGASVTAIRDGRPVDTSMGFTPLGGIMMATRPGDLDPGVLLYARRVLSFTDEQLRDELTNRSGLLGVSRTSADMRELLAAQASDARARRAVDLFVYIARKHIGALVAVLGGLDTLVFTAGIGENSAEIRERIAEPFTAMMPVDVRVVPTNELLVLARKAYGLSGG